MSPHFKEIFFSFKQFFLGIQGKSTSVAQSTGNMVHSLNHAQIIERTSSNYHNRAQEYQSRANENGYPAEHRFASQADQLSRESSL